MRLAEVSLCVALASLYAQPSPGVASQALVTAEFRIFEGRIEITDRTRLRIMPAGDRQQARTLEPSRRPAVALPPGIYDVQVMKLNRGAVTGIAWAERLVIMQYPDEGGRHLEVINLVPGHGALQLRSAKRAVAEYNVTIYASRDRQTPVTSAATGHDYLLFVLQSGRYDVRIRREGTAASAGQEQWLLDVDVPPQRTRLKLID